uniref:C2H2-type domain-containing protein n=1 Tax=Setaria digitata TaxID=48799 RepID=A0A915PU52_9BILA
MTEELQLSSRFNCREAKAKNLKKQEALKKSVGHDQKGACLKSLIYKCTVCMAQMMDKRSYKEHFESKHPKNPLPAELVEQPAGS